MDFDNSFDYKLPIIRFGSTKVTIEVKPHMVDDFCENLTLLLLKLENVDNPLTLKQVKSFSAPSLSRNPAIVYVLDKLKLVEQRGLGFKTIKELPTQNLPLPFVTFDDPYLVFTFPRSVDVLRSLEVVDFEELTEEELRGFEWIRETGEISSKEYATRFGLTQRTASRHITKMIELHLLETNGESLKSPKLRYKVRYE
jgi:predicted HTH transcriptional regulator